MSETYVVVVRHNLVCAIERAAPQPNRPVSRTPLEIGTELAQNNRRHGCIDGRYYFESAQRARIFAALCLEFTKAMAEKRLAIVDALPAGRPEYHADEP